MPQDDGELQWQFQRDSDSSSVVCCTFTVLCCSCSLLSCGVVGLV